MASFIPPFAYNTGGPISGTTQYGDFVVGNVEVDYGSNYGGVQWWASPEELTGYIIGNARPGGQPVPSGVTGTANVGFWRSKGRTDQDFLDLANYIGGKNGQTFTTTNDAEVWLESNGYYTSFNLPTPTPTTTQTQTPTRTPTRTPTPTLTPTNTPYPPGAYKFYLAEGSGPVVPQSNGDMMLIAGGDVITYNPNDNFEITFTAIDKSGTSHPEYNDLLTYGGTITLTQGANTYIASGESGFFSYTSTIVPYYSASYLDIIQPSPNPFVSGSPIFLTASVNYPPTPTPTPTVTPTLTQTQTPSVTPTLTQTQTPSGTSGPTPSVTPTLTRTPTPTPGRLKVLFLGDTSVNTVATIIDNYITITGQSISYSAVTMGTTYTGSGNITKSNYDVVMIYTNSSQIGTTTMANALTTFVGQGGSIVSGTFLWNLAPAGYNYTGTTTFNANPQSNPPAGDIIINSATTITNGIGLTMPTFSNNGAITLNSGSVRLATYSNGNNLLAVKSVGTAKLVSINAFPNYIINTSSTITKMFGNAILYAGGKI